MKPSPDSQDPLARRLRGIPLAPIPDAWRTSILDAARRAVPDQTEIRIPSWTRANAWFAPWRILAGAWVLVAILLVLQHQMESGLHTSGSPEWSSVIPDPSWSLAARAYRLELLSSLDGAASAEVPSAEPRPSPPAPSSPAAPRSELHRRVPAEADEAVALPV